MKTLFIDACPRKNSRTRALAEAFLQKLDGEIETLYLPEVALPDLTGDLLEKRTEDCKKGDYSDYMYLFAGQLAAADRVVIAAPFWDQSFPACLKKYIETISVAGLTFRYGEDGIPIGLCKAKKLMYITTAGGKIFNDAFGYGYIELLAKMMLGIPECSQFKVEFLDVIGNDVEQIMADAMAEIQKLGEEW